MTFRRNVEEECKTRLYRGFATEEKEEEKGEEEGEGKKEEEKKKKKKKKNIEKLKN